MALMKSLIARIFSFHRTSPLASVAIWFCAWAATALLAPPFEPSDLLITVLFGLIVGLAIFMKVTLLLSGPDEPGPPGSPCHADLRSAAYYFRQCCLIGIDMMVVLGRALVLAAVWCVIASVYLAFTQMDRAQELAEAALDAKPSEWVVWIPHLVVAYSMIYLMIQAMSVALFKRPTFPLAGTRPTVPKAGL